MERWLCQAHSIAGTRATRFCDLPQLCIPPTALCRNLRQCGKVLRGRGNSMRGMRQGKKPTPQRQHSWTFEHLNHIFLSARSSARDGSRQPSFRRDGGWWSGQGAPSGLLPAHGAQATLSAPRFDGSPHADAHSRPGVGRPRPPRRLARPLGVGPRQESGARCHRLQSLQAHHRRRARPMALHGEHRQGAGCHRRQHRGFQRPLGGTRGRPPGAPPGRCRLCRGSALSAPLAHHSSSGPRPGRPGRLFRRCRLSRRGGMGRDRLPRHRGRARVCAGDCRRFHAAGLSRGRHRHRLAHRLRAPGGPGDRQDPRGRGDGEGTGAPHRPHGGTALAQSRA